MNTINQYSSFFISAFILSVVGYFLITNKAGLKGWISFFAIVSALVVAWFSLRPQQTALLGDAATVQAAIGSGQPVLLEFQSPY